VTAGGHLVVRGPDEPGALALATAVVDAALESERWTAVTVLVDEAGSRLLAGQPWAARVRAFAAGDEARAWLALGADAALLLTESPGSAWAALRARVPLRAGVGGGFRGMSLTHAVSPPSCAGRCWSPPLAHLQRDLAGLLDVQVGDRAPCLRASAEGARRAARHLALAGAAPTTAYVASWTGTTSGGGSAHSVAPFLEHLGVELALAAVVAEGASAGDVASPSVSVTSVAGAKPNPITSSTADANPNPKMSASAPSPAREHASTARRAADTGGTVAPRDTAVVRLPVGGDLELAVGLLAGARLLVAQSETARWIAAALGVPCLRLSASDAPPSPAGFLERLRVVHRDAAAHRSALGFAPAPSAALFASGADAAHELLAEEGPAP
jgi:hypothetical protein